MSPRSVLLVLGITVLLTSGAYGYTKLLARVGSGMPPKAAPAGSQADRIVVSKADKEMYLFRDARMLRRYRISMGNNWQDGHKQSEGDERTPEGAYIIDWRNPNSIAHLSLHISYPNVADRETARRQGYDPGGNIMIHGLPNGWGALGSVYHLTDWTDGCIAVTNAEMREIWSLVPNGTPIEIHARWQP